MYAFGGVLGMNASSTKHDTAQSEFYGQRFKSSHKNAGAAPMNAIMTGRRPLRAVMLCCTTLTTVLGLRLAL